MQICLMHRSIGMNTPAVKNHKFLGTWGLFNPVFRGWEAMDLIAEVIADRKPLTAERWKLWKIELAG